MYWYPQNASVITSVKATSLLFMFWLSHFLLFGSVYQPKSQKPLEKYHQFILSAPKDAAPSAEPHQLKVLVYNVFMRFRLPLLFLDGQRRRADMIPSYLRGYDALVLLELFDRDARKRILAKLKRWYPYHTKALKGSSWFSADSGVMVLSKWPIRAQDSLAYKTCAGMDCVAYKGIVYAAIQKKDRPYHIFATHAQAHSNPVSRGVRQKQFRTLRRFIQSKQIPHDQAVLISGDLNVDKLNYPNEYKEMLTLLNASSPQSFFGPPWTFQPQVNQLASGPTPEFLDYVLPSKQHLQPVRSSLTTQVFQTTQPWRNATRDLSDHYSVVGHFQFPAR